MELLKQLSQKLVTEAKQKKLSKQQIKAGVEKAEKSFERKGPKNLDWGDNFRAFLAVVYITAYQDGFDAKRPGLEQKLSLSQTMIDDGLSSAEEKMVPNDLDWGDNLQKLIEVTYETGYSEGWDDRFFQSE